jgi:hypothetical protein
MVTVMYMTPRCVDLEFSVRTPTYINTSGSENRNTTCFIGSLL